MNGFRVFDNKENKYVDLQSYPNFYIKPDGTLIIIDRILGEREADTDRYTVEMGVELKGKVLYSGDIMEYTYGMTTFTGVVEFHDKVLEIGGESDRVRFTGFILHSCIGTSEEYYCPIPNPELAVIKVTGTIHEEGGNES